MTASSLRILHVASEVAPFSKSGGLADVCSSLPIALSENGHDIVVISPYYGTLRQLVEKSGGTPETLTINNRKFDIEYAEHIHERTNIRFIFVRCDELFDRAGYYYDPATSSDYDDNDARFAVFACAALAWCVQNAWLPEVVHGHDWQTGALPLFLRSPRFGNFFTESRFTLTIHNMAFQGRFHAGSRAWIDNAEDYAFLGGPAEFHGTLNLLKLAIEFADALNTVSPTYAHELRTIDQMGFGLGPLLHKRHTHFSGILNGLDTVVWNPETDENLQVRYNATTLALRNRNKRVLSEKAGFTYDKSMPIVSMVTRISEQKGFGVLIPVIGELISTPAQFIILGNGDPDFESQLRELERAYPQRIKLITEYSESIAHLIYGGADMFLMPSLFEPCGLSQMMALRYGTPPIARETGGLADTISDYSHNPISGTGFLFRDYSSYALSGAIKRALVVYKNTTKWRNLQRHGMKEDFSWRRSARVYEEMYKRVLNSPPAMP